MPGLSRRHVMRAGWGGAVLGAIVACAPAGSGGDAAPAAGSGKQVTLRIGARAAAVAANPSWEEYQAAKQLFESKYPKITLDITPVMNSEKFLAAAAAGDAWDVQDLCCDQLPLEARAGVLTKLDPYIKRA